MPVPTVQTKVPTAPSSHLPPAGVAMMLFLHERLSPPRPSTGKPGIVCTAYQGRPDVVLMQARGYSPLDGNTAICTAAQACIDNGFVVSFAGNGVEGPARLVRRFV